MRQQTHTLNILLAAVLGGVLLVCVAVRAFAPQIILPVADIPNLVLLSVITLTLEHYLAPEEGRSYGIVALLSAVTFGVLPYAAGFAAPLAALKLALTGGAVFTACAWLYASARERLTTGPIAKAAPIFVGIGLWLAAQCFAGM